MLDVSTLPTKMAWQDRQRAANLTLALAAKRQAIMDRLLRYRQENARPEDIQRGKPLPQEEAATRGGIRPRQWQRWETGESMPHPKNLQQLAKKLRIPVAQFFDETDTGAIDGTPDLIGAVSGGARTDDLQEDLAELHRKLNLLIDYFDITATEDGHPQITYGDAYSAAAKPPRPGEHEETEDAT